MDQVKLISTDGECEITIIRNYMMQGRPGFTVRYPDEDGAAVTKEFPLPPKGVTDIVRLMTEAEHHMFEFLAAHLYANSPTAEDLIKKAVQDAENVLNFRRKD